MTFSELRNKPLKIWDLVEYEDGNYFFENIKFKSPQNSLSRERFEDILMLRDAFEKEFITKIY